ncbi:MAG TPA: SgcJ/EcaC family oxidoreductase [Gemmatimonadaceae bacterium]|nr:SgcJ/EcaC family oxidoreductase [Gemmatimonadaceae bacterium]
MRHIGIYALLRLALVAVAPAACTVARGAPPPAGGAPRAEIAAMLDRSARAWNRGDLDAFVDDYLDSDRTTFIGRRGVLHGRAAIRAVYAPRFAPGGVRDSLSFEQLEVDSLAPGVAHVLAYYVLSRGDSTVARGPTSLVMLRVDGRWRIVHDHSS